MLRRILLAIVVGVVVTLVCMFVGRILMTVDISWVAAAGVFLDKFGGLLGLLSAIWYGAGGQIPRP